MSQEASFNTRGYLIAMKWGKPGNNRFLEEFQDRHFNRKFPNIYLQLYINSLYNFIRKWKHLCYRNLF